MHSVYDKLMSLDAYDMGVPVVLDLTGGDGYTIVPFEDICKRDRNIREKFGRMELHDIRPPTVGDLTKVLVEVSLDVLCYSGTCVDDRDRDACQGYGLLFKKAIFVNKGPSDAIFIDGHDLFDHKSRKRNVFISNGTCVNWPDSLQDLARPKAFLFAFHWGMFQDGDRADRKDASNIANDLEIYAKSGQPIVIRVHNLNERPAFSVDKEMSFYDGPEFFAIRQDSHFSLSSPNGKAKSKGVKDDNKVEATPVTQPVTQPVTRTQATATDEEKERNLLKWFKNKSKAYQEYGLSGLKDKLHEFNERWNKIGDRYTYTDNIFLAGEDQVPVYYQYEFDRFELEIGDPGSASKCFDDLFSSAKDAGDLRATTDSDRDAKLKLANFVLRHAHLGKKASTIDIFDLKERSSIWWDIPTIQKRYIIDGKKFEIPKLKLGFETDGIPSKNDSCFPAPSDYISDRHSTELWMKKCTELEKFCKIVHGLTVNHGVITSIPAFILGKNGHKLLVKFNNGNLISIPATQLERDFLFQQKEVSLHSWPCGNSGEAKLFGPNGFDILKDRFITDRDIPKQVMLSFTTHTGEERKCKLEQKILNAERMRTMSSKKGAVSARAPFATGGKKRGGENKGVQPKRVKAPYATYDDESMFDRR